MKKILFLHYYADCNTNDIWKAAINNGWSTERVDMSGKFTPYPDGSVVCYYGNTLHGAIIGDHIPIRFHELDLTVLTKTGLTKRSVSLMRACEIPDLTEPKFIKPAQNKWFPAKVYNPGESPARAQGGAVLASDLIYVQDPVNIINEMRCFCLDGKISTSSFYRISKDYAPLNCDWHRPKAIDDMVTELAPHYPRGVVLDFGFTDSGGWLFIEPNEAWASGIYGCDPVACLDVIEASQEERP